jgi:integrase
MENDDLPLPVDETPAEPSTALAVVADLAAKAQALAAESIAGSTRRVYAYDWRRFTEWCQAHELDPLGPPGIVALYLTARVEDGASVAALSRCLAAIARAHQAAGRSNPRRDPAVALVFSGARRKLGVAPEQVEAILPTQLRVMVERMPKTGPHRIRYLRNRALLTLGWTIGCRRSELVALDVADLEWVPEGLRVRIRRSKTDQEGKGRVVGVPYASQLQVCAVRALREYLDGVGVTEGPVFCGTTAKGDALTGHRLTDRQVANVIGTCAKRADLAGRFAGHSLRAGFVTAAVRANKSLRSVMQQTGHRTTEVLMRYVREQAIFNDNAAAGLL